MNKTKTKTKQGGFEIVTELTVVGRPKRSITEIENRISAAVPKPISIIGSISDGYRADRVRYRIVYRYNQQIPLSVIDQIKNSFTDIGLNITVTTGLYNE